MHAILPTCLATFIAAQYFSMVMPVSFFPYSARATLENAKSSEEIGATLASLQRAASLCTQIPKVGLEPTRPCGHWILSPARLPFRHFGLSGTGLETVKFYARPPRRQCLQFVAVRGCFCRRRFDDASPRDDPSILRHRRRQRTAALRIAMRMALQSRLEDAGRSRQRPRFFPQKNDLYYECSPTKPKRRCGKRCETDGLNFTQVKQEGFDS